MPHPPLVAVVGRSSCTCRLIRQPPSIARQGLLSLNGSRHSFTYGSGGPSRCRSRVTFRVKATREREAALVVENSVARSGEGGPAGDRRRLPWLRFAVAARRRGLGRVRQRLLPAPRRGIASEARSGRGDMRVQGLPQGGGPRRRHLVEVKLGKPAITFVMKLMQVRWSVSLKRRINPEIRDDVP